MTKRTWLSLLAAATLALVMAAGMPGAGAQQDAGLRARLSGANEVGGGDPDGSGKAEFWADGDSVCYHISWKNIGGPTAGHIHMGAGGETGPVVETLFTHASGAPGRWVEHCTSDYDEALAAQILANPSAYYVNLHNPRFPDGAIRGQLEAD